MWKKLSIDGRGICYFLRRSNRSRGVRLSIDGAAKITVSASKHIPLFLLQKFILQKSVWILEKLEYFKNNPDKPRLGGSPEDFIKRKKDARHLVKQKITQWNRIYDFDFKKFTIRNQKSRWGSCSHRKVLNFNYKLVYLPEPLADYLIVHELCHLKEMNHSHRFWAEVSRAIPDYTLRRRKLKKFKFAED